MEKVIRTAGVVAFQDNKVLLVRHGVKAEHHGNTYGLPAGRVEPGESSADTAMRELFEESGLTTTLANLKKIQNIYHATLQRKDGPQNFSQENYLCDRWSGELRGNEETVPEWIGLDGLDKLALLPNVRKMVQDALTLKEDDV